ncbi:MAG: hypothetical protein J0L81_07795 [Caulobacterales bacterium]|jgi:hypothetical protein|nr:hypothetical protein [Caulobacterales bacterium]
MRALLLAAVLTATLASVASATEGPNAREAYVERRGLLEADAQCRLLTPSIRAALQVGVTQARGSLLRAGWSNAQMRQLESAVVSAARARACNDARTHEAATGANRSFAQWANAGTMQFPGWERTWTARRAAGGWRLSQNIDGPLAATFGVRDSDNAQRLTLVIADATSARLVMRDARRAGPVEVTLPQRMSYGLAAGAAPTTAAQSVPSTRSVERLSGGRSQAVFVFPDTAFRDLLALDPRESVEIHVTQGRATHRLLVEVGDIAAARAFLTLQR